MKLRIGLILLSSFSIIIGITIKTKLLPTPVIEVENFTTWTQSKKVNIYYNGKR